MGPEQICLPISCPCQSWNVSQNIWFSSHSMHVTLPSNDYAEAKGHLQKIVQTVVQYVARL